MSSVEHLVRTITALSILALTPPVFAQDEAHSGEAHGAEPAATEEAETHEEAETDEEYDPPLPEGMTLDEVLSYSATPPPKDSPRTIPDDRVYAFLLGEQLEYRLDAGAEPGELGWEFQAWVGGDLHKLWLKTEGESVFVGEQEVESENDLLYSTLVMPFWNMQVGAQYANGWSPDGYEDRWSGAAAIQGMAPGSFEIDASFYFSEGLDLTASLTAEYDLRITQRLVFQPHAELGFSAQEIPERGLGIGLTQMDLDGRLRYEIKREFAPYLGARYHLLTFGTAEMAREAGEPVGAFLVLAGLRFAI